MIATGIDPDEATGEPVGAAGEPVGAAGEPVGAASEAVGSAGEPMVKVRPGDPMGMPLARARVFGALFGEDSTLGTFGKYRVLGRLGAGGMGVVYEAYDPNLARGVALKLVNVAAKDRDTALTEAKALAQLSHPNVVPIYDADLERDYVYLAMELVRGETLRRWTEGRAPREILAVYQQAGAGLAAAHAIGLVHRDFKPENAIVGRDGRVRVVDFGLACEADDPARATGRRRGAAGTPGFMAPEIVAGAAVTPAADQYSFCVALGDALAHASQPAPRRIAAVLARGRAAATADRFASMHDLLAALARDPARAWRRSAVAGALVASVGAGAFFLGRAGPSEADACDGGRALLDAAWRPADRAVALDRVAALGDYGRSLRPLLERGLDAHRRDWVREHRVACLDHRRGTESSAQVDRRTTCLTRGSDALAAVGELIAHIEPDHLEQLPRAVQSLPDPAACSDRNTLLSDIAPPPPERAAPVAEVRRAVAAARIHVGAGRYEQAASDAGKAVAQARAIGYPPVLAEALLVQGHALMPADRKVAVPVLAEATTTAIAAHADATAVEAWARRAWAQGTSTDPEGALAGSEVIEALAQRTAWAGFARALLYNNLGSVELGREHGDRARAYFTRALAEAGAVTGDGALELLAIRTNIGIFTTDRARGDQLLVAVAADSARLLGADHPETLMIPWLRGTTTVEHLGDAVEVLVPACRGYEQHPRLADRTSGCWTEVGWLRWELGDPDAAVAALERAVRVQADAAEAVPYLTLFRGDPRGAARQFTAALAAAPPRRDDHWWDRLSRAYLNLGLGRARRAAGDLAGARSALEASVAELEGIVRAHPAASYERRLGRARVELAVTLAGLGMSRASRAEVAAAASAWLRRVAGTAAEPLRLATELEAAR